MKSTYHVVSALLLTALAAVAAPARAADAPAKAPAKISANGGKAHKRTIKDMVALAMKEGGDDTLKAPTTVNLGLSDGVKKKLISYSEEKTGDNRAHEFSVILDDKGRAKEVLWMSMAISKEADKTRIDSRYFRTTLSGKLISSIRANGIVGEVVQTKVDVKNKAIIAAYEADKTYLLDDCFNLPFEKE